MRNTHDRRLGLLITAVLLTAVAGTGTAAGAANDSAGSVSPGLSPAAAGASTWIDGYDDAAGYHLSISADGATWAAAATIAPSRDGATRTGYQCLSQDGRYAAVALLDMDRVEDATSRDRGADAYAVDLTTGTATLLAQDVGLKYFSPGCGTGSSAVFTSYLGTDQQTTRLRTADLATGTLGPAVDLDGQVTSTVPTATGPVGVQDGDLVSAAADGSLTTLATVDGDPFQLRSTPAGVEFLTVRGGDVTGHRLTAAGVTAQESAAEPVAPRDPAALATDTARMTPDPGATPKVSAPPGTTSPTTTTLAAVSGSTVENPQSACAVPRLDPAIQVYQPSTAQVDWAVQQAVRGTLAASDDFPGTPLRGPANATTGVPRAVLSGIIAQESNLQQANRYTPAGATGGPLVGNYYGSNGALTTMNPANPDCGYGLTQVTTGMRTGDTVYTPAQQRMIATDYRANVAAGLEILQDKWNQLYNLGIIANTGDPQYLENWYFALWAYNSGVNAVDPQSGNSGLGWTNNPANPDYPPTRAPFLRDTYGDAARPASWPYQERVLGWMGRPQIVNGVGAYPKATFGAGSSWLSLPPSTAFCDPDENDCDPEQFNSSNTDAGHCTLDSYKCWWSDSATWPGALSTSPATIAAAAPEPAKPAVAAASCTVDRTIIPSSAVIVDNLPTGTRNLLRCSATPNWTSAGTFTYTYGTNAAGDTLGAIDTHQVGSGLGGHTLFTHTDDGTNPALINSGTWTPSLPGTGGSAGQFYTVMVHLPAFVADARNVVYTIDPGNGGLIRNIRANQTTPGETWLSLGTFRLVNGATVTLTNAGSDDVNGDVAFDAVAFLPKGTSVVFPDVPTRNSFHADITWLAEQGITGGFSDGGFHPDEKVSRPAMAAFLYRLVNPGAANPLCTGTSRRFIDVPKATSFCGVIEWTAAQGIATGSAAAGGRRTFDVTEEVSRQAMAAFLWRTLNPGRAIPSCNGVRPFPDVTATSPFCGAIKDLVAAGVIKGYADGTFRPGTTVDRQATAAFLHRAGRPALTAQLRRPPVARPLSHDGGRATAPTAPRCHRYRMSPGA